MNTLTKSVDPCLWMCFFLIFHIVSFAIPNKKLRIIITFLLPTLYTDSKMKGFIEQVFPNWWNSYVKRPNRTVSHGQWAKRFLKKSTCKYQRCLDWAVPGICLWLSPYVLSSIGGQVSSCQVEAGTGTAVCLYGGGPYQTVQPTLSRSCQTAPVTGASSHRTEKVPFSPVSLNSPICEVVKDKSHVILPH